MINKGWVLVIFLLGMLLASSVIHIVTLYKPQKQQPKITPCECLSLETTLLYVEKSEMFLDKLQTAKKGQRNSLIDSVNKYRTLLRSNGNIIEY